MEEVVLITAPSEEVGRTLARTLVEEGLAACVNLVPGLTSVYRWQGEVVEAARAIEKARWLARSIPDEAYARAGGVNRQGWEQYLATIAASDLFREARADAR